MVLLKKPHLVSIRQKGLTPALLFSLAFISLAGCSALPKPTALPVQYDFGPSPSPVSTVHSSALDVRPLLIINTTEPKSPLNKDRLFYRFAYGNQQQLSSYQLASWSQPASQLFLKQLREVLQLQRPILADYDVLPQFAQNHRYPLVLWVSLQRMEHVFSSPTQSKGVMQVNASLINPEPKGNHLLGQRVFVQEFDAPSTDAAGAVVALSLAAQTITKELTQWLEQTAPERIDNTE